MSKNYVSTVIKTAESQLGYLEKKSNKDLYDKTANAGSANYTKYAYEFDTKYVGFYNGKKNGFAWCDVFVDWCFVTAFGVEEAKKLLCQPKKSLGAGCKYSRDYYKAKGQHHTTPKVGDQIFFYDSTKKSIAHTGLVYKVDSKYVYTIEGNTSSASGVVANGGAVEKKKYKLTYTRIAGYGRPKYDAEPEATKTESVKTNNKKTEFNEAVQDWQKAAIADGYKFPKYGADGEWGSECEAVAKKAICKKCTLIYKNKNLTKIVQKAVGAKADGKFGNDTKKKVMKWQGLMGLKQDGVVGYNTWKKILGVK